MYWIIQENLWNEDGHSQLLQALEKNKSQYTIVKVRPFIHTIEPDCWPPNPVMVIGSTTLVQIGKSRGWYPSAFLNENFDYRVQIREYGEEMLNHESIMGRFGSIEPEWNYFFIRPPEDSKLFTGQVMDRNELAEWKQNTAEAYSDGYTQLTPDTEVMIAKVRTIYSEHRLFMVNKKFVTGSVYRRHGRPYQDGIIDTDIIDYAEMLANHWVPALAYCLDVARTDEGLKVIEINCINSAGFYKSDVSKTIQALEALFA